MKPRVTIRETTLPNGSVLALQEHDSRFYLMQDANQIAGPSIRISEREMARLGCAPFRPARQPKILLVGLGLGEALSAVTESLLQKRGTFHIAEPQGEIVAWQRECFPESVFNQDPRVQLHGDAGPTGLASFEGGLHAIMLHTDTAPALPGGQLMIENPRWLAAAYDALQEGGLLSIASSAKLPRLEAALKKQGFLVVTQEINAVPNARRPRSHWVWLARKGEFPR